MRYTQCMSTPNRPNTVTFTTKGQVVIPAQLRKEFHIKPGTRAVVEQTENGILLRPITQWAIDRLHGVFADPNGTPFREEWAQYKREERAREDRLLGERVDGEASDVDRRS